MRWELQEISMYNRDRLSIILLSLLIFRIPVSRIIGDNGCGYLSGAFELFWCLTTLFGAGLYATMSGMMRDRIRRNQHANAGLIFRLAKSYTFICSIVILVILTLLHVSIGNRLFMDPGSRISLLFVGLSVFLGLIVNLNIGYLIGTGNRRAAIIGEVFYGLSMGIGMLLGSVIGIRTGGKIAALLRNEEVSAIYGATGAMIGICAGEFISMVLFVTMTLIYQRSFRHIMRSEENRRLEGPSDVAGKLFGGIFIDGIGELILYLPVLISIIIYRRYGTSVGMSDVGEAVGAFFSKYIVVTGVLFCLAVFPIQSSLKGIAAAYSDSDDQLCADRISVILARIIYFTVPAVVFVTMLSQLIITTIFTGRTTTAVALLNSGTFVVFIYSIAFLLISVLDRLGYSREMVIVGAISLVVGTVISYLLVTKKEAGFLGCVYGVMISMALCIIVCSIIILRNYPMHFKLVYHLVLPLVISGIIGLIIKLVSEPLSKAVGNILTLIICIVPAWLIYNTACLFFKVVSPKAMKRKLLGSVFVRIGQDLGLY